MSPEKTIELFHKTINGWTVERYTKYHGKYLLFARKDSDPGYVKWFSINPLTKMVGEFLVQNDPEGLAEAINKMNVVLKQPPVIDKSQIRL